VPSWRNRTIVRPVAAIGDVVVRAAGERGVTRKAGIRDLGHDGGEIDRPIQLRDHDSPRRGDPENCAVLDQVKGDHRVPDRICDEQGRVGDPVEHDAGAGGLRRGGARAPRVDRG